MLPIEKNKGRRQKTKEGTVAQDSDKMWMSSAAHSLPWAGAKAQLLAGPDCIRKLLSTMGNASGMVARIAKCLKKLLIHCHVSPWSAKAEEQWWDAYCFGSQDFLPAALASLLFSKILLLPSPGNETCRSSETCDYDFFSLNHAVYLSLNVLFLCFLIFMVAAMHWVSVPTACSRSLPQCQVLPALSETFLRAGSASVWVGFLPIHPENESLKRLFLFTHRVNSIVYIACEF